MQSGWGQFGAVKKLFSFIAWLRRQLNARYPNQAKGDRQAPALPPYITPPGLAYRPDVPEASRWPRIAAVYTSALASE